jgi:serine/threonine protein phosphatase 1
MLNRLFGLTRQREHEPGPEGVAPEVPAGSRVYAVGDIHGCVELLRQMHQLIHQDAYRRQASRNVVIYLGDYVDRGSDSPAVIDVLLDEPLPSFESVHLKGNHEESLLRFLTDTSVGAAWMAYGGAATLLSYGVRPPGPATIKPDFTAAQHALSARLPERHRRFLSGLRLTHTEGDYFFTHAGVRPGIPLDQQAEDDLLWIRDDFLRSDVEYGKIVVHGHSITAQPDVQRNRIGIDTGAFASGTLTCLVLEGSDWSFLHT